MLNASDERVAGDERVADEGSRASSVERRVPTVVDPVTGAAIPPARVYEEVLHMTLAGKEAALVRLLDACRVNGACGRAAARAKRDAERVAGGEYATRK